MRALIVGNSGAGKTTLARQLFRNLASIPSDSRPVFDPQTDRAILNLDTIAWDEPINGQVQRRSIDASVAQINRFIAQAQHWAIEGCYGELIEAAMSPATVLYWLDPPLETCLDRCRNRAWEPDKFATPDEQNAALANLLEWVATYDDRDDEFGRAYHGRLFDQFPGEKHHLIH
jgi:adenylate kinase family enzyme